MNNAELADSDARAVLFRQRFGSLTPAIGSMVTVGVADGQIAYVSSSLTRTTGLPGRCEDHPARGLARPPPRTWRKVRPAAVSGITSDRLRRSDGAWTRLDVPGILQEQQARVRALALRRGSVRPVIEANVVNVAGGYAVAYTVLVDAVSGKVLVRHNKVDNLEYNNVFAGEITATDLRPAALVQPDRQPDQDRSSPSATGSPVNDFTLKVLPGRDAADHRGHRTNPEAADRHRPDRVPGRHLLGAGVPLRRSSPPAVQLRRDRQHQQLRRPGAGTGGRSPSGASSPATRR